MAFAAIKLYRYNLSHPGEYAHLLSLLAVPRGFAGGDYAKLQYWGAIEEDAGRRADGSSRVGYWRITQIGAQWVTRSIRLPRYVRVYNSSALGPPTPYTKSGRLTSPVGIDDALGNKFDYDKLMAGEG
jgi:hypothetical protein